MVVVPSVVGGWSPVVFLCPPPRGRRECARLASGQDVLSGGSLCVLGARAVGSAGWGSPVAWRGSVVVVKPSISEVGSSACTPLLLKHRALSPGQVGSHTNVEGVCQLLSCVSLLQYGELIVPSVQSCYDGAGTVVVVLGPNAVSTFNVVFSPGLAARIKAVQELNHLADTSCVPFVRAFVNVGKANVVPAGKRLQLVHFLVNVQTDFHKMVFPVIQVRALTVKQFTLLIQVPYILLELVVRCLKS